MTIHTLLRSVIILAVVAAAQPALAAPKHLPQVLKLDGSQLKCESTKGKKDFTGYVAPWDQFSKLVGQAIGATPKEGVNELYPMPESCERATDSDACMLEFCKACQAKGSAGCDYRFSTVAWLDYLKANERATYDQYMAAAFPYDGTEKESASLLAWPIRDLSGQPISASDASQTQAAISAWLKGWTDKYSDTAAKEILSSMMTPKEFDEWIKWDFTGFKQFGSDFVALLVQGPSELSKYVRRGEDGTLSFVLRFTPSEKFADLPKPAFQDPKQSTPASKRRPGKKVATKQAPSTRGRRFRDPIFEQTFAMQKQAKTYTGRQQISQAMNEARSQREALYKQIEDAEQTEGMDAESLKKIREEATQKIIDNTSRLLSDARAASVAHSGEGYDYATPIWVDVRAFDCMFMTPERLARLSLQQAVGWDPAIHGKWLVKRYPKLGYKEVPMAIDTKTGGVGGACAYAQKYNGGRLPVVTKPSLLSFLRDVVALAGPVQERQNMIERGLTVGFTDKERLDPKFDLDAYSPTQVKLPEGYQSMTTAEFMKAFALAYGVDPNHTTAIMAGELGSNEGYMATLERARFAHENELAYWKLPASCRENRAALKGAGCKLPHPGIDPISYMITPASDGNYLVVVQKTGMREQHVKASFDEQQKWAEYARKSGFEALTGKKLDDVSPDNYLARAWITLQYGTAEAVADLHDTFYRAGKWLLYTCNPFVNDKKECTRQMDEDIAQMDRTAPLLLAPEKIVGFKETDTVWSSPRTTIFNSYWWENETAKMLPMFLIQPVSGGLAGLVELSGMRLLEARLTTLGLEQVAERAATRMAVSTMVERMGARAASEYLLKELPNASNDLKKKVAQMVMSSPQSSIVSFEQRLAQIGLSPAQSESLLQAAAKGAGSTPGELMNLATFTLGSKAGAFQALLPAGMMGLYIGAQNGMHNFKAAYAKFRAEGLSADEARHKASQVAAATAITTGMTALIGGSMSPFLTTAEVSTWNRAVAELAKAIEPKQLLKMSVEMATWQTETKYILANATGEGQDKVFEGFFDAMLMGAVFHMQGRAGAIANLASPSRYTEARKAAFERYNKVKGIEAARAQVLAKQKAGETLSAAELEMLKPSFGMAAGDWVVLNDLTGNSQLVKVENVSEGQIEIATVAGRKHKIDPNRLSFYRPDGKAVKGGIGDFIAMIRDAARSEKQALVLAPEGAKSEAGAASAKDETVAKHELAANVWSQLNEMRLGVRQKGVRREMPAGFENEIWAIHKLGSEKPGRDGKNPGGFFVEKDGTVRTNYTDSDLALKQRRTRELLVKSGFNETRAKAITKVLMGKNLRLLGDQITEGGSTEKVADATGLQSKGEEIIKNGLDKVRDKLDRKIADAAEKSLREAKAEDAEALDFVAKKVSAPMSEKELDTLKKAFESCFGG